MNLPIHALAVPLFIVSTVRLADALLLGSWLAAGTWLGAIGVSMSLQGLGHRRESLPPEPFAGPGDFIKRILIEQFYRFPRFVLSGQWWSKLRY